MRHRITARAERDLKDIYRYTVATFGHAQAERYLRELDAVFEILGDYPNNARLRDELLDGEIFYSLREAQIVIESRRRHYNTIRPHGSIGYKPPAPEVFVPAFAAWPQALTRPAPPAKLTLAQKPTLN